MIYIISKLAFYVHCQWIKGHTTICKQTYFLLICLSIQAKSFKNLTHNSHLKSQNGEKDNNKLLDHTEEIEEDEGKYRKRKKIGARSKKRIPGARHPHTQNK